ncbi:MAG: hypothetical protein KGV44_09095 [Flavobacteriaceae bacterium]|nr:hypothetical protein [Flavobacteriaceae bacterium]
MKYLIKITSEEQNDFSFQVKIDATATFLALHNLIIENCGYDGSQLSSFFTLDTEKQRLQEISLMELSADGEEMNVAVMDVATLGEFIGKEIKFLEFEYDFFGDRFFSLEIIKVLQGKQAKAEVLELKGTPPPQLSLDGFEGLDFSAKASQNEEIDYEKYLASFDDCKDEIEAEFQSLEDWDDDEF